MKALMGLPLVAVVLTVISVNTSSAACCGAESATST